MISRPPTNTPRAWRPERKLHRCRSFHPWLVLGVGQLRARAVPRGAGSRYGLRADRTRLRHLRHDRGARCAGAQDQGRRRGRRERRRLCAVLREARAGLHQQRRHHRRRDGLPRAGPGSALAIIFDRCRARRSPSARTRSRRRCGTTSRTRTMSPKAPARHRSRPCCRNATRMAGKRVALVLSGGNIDREKYAAVLNGGG